MAGEADPQDVAPRLGTAVERALDPAEPKGAFCDARSSGRAGRAGGRGGGPPRPEQRG